MTPKKIKAALKVMKDQAMLKPIKIPERGTYQ